MGVSFEASASLRHPRMRWFGGTTLMVEPDDSIFPLLRERRAALQKDALDADRCFALNEAWLTKLRRRRDLLDRVVQGEIILADYAAREVGMDPEETDATPEAPEPRD